MKRRIRNGNLLSFSLGLLVSLILPQGWLVVVLAVVLTVTALAGAKCCRF